MVDKTALFVACRTNDVKLLETFVAEHPEKENYVLDLSYSLSCPLHIAICNNSCEIVEYLLKNKLVDLYKKYDEGAYFGNCLDLALTMGTQLVGTEWSIDMVKLLIDNDENYQLVDESMIGVQLLANIFENCHATVELLKARNYTVPKTEPMNRLGYLLLSVHEPQKSHYFLEIDNLKLLSGDNKQRTIELLNYFTTKLYRLSVYDYPRTPDGTERISLHPDHPDIGDLNRNDWRDVLSKVFSMLLDLNADFFVNNLPRLMILMQEYDLKDWIDRCIETWYLTKTNEHRSLIETLLNQQQNGIQNFDVIIGLTSHDLRYACGNDDSYWYVNNPINKRLLECLIENSTKWTANEMIEIGYVLSPKLDDEFFSFAFYEYFSKVFTKTKSASSIFKIVDKMQLAEKIQHLNKFVVEFECSWLALMAFSTEVTVDAHFAGLPKYWKKREKEISNEIDIRSLGAGNWGNPRVLKEEEMNRLRNIWLDIEESAMMTEFRAQNLKHLCRTKIRKLLTETNTNVPKITHSQLVRNVRLLNLPKQLQQFVLFNYTDYEF